MRYPKGALLTLTSARSYPFEVSQSPLEGTPLPLPTLCCQWPHSTRHQVRLVSPCQTLRNRNVPKFSIGRRNVLTGSGGGRDKVRKCSEVSGRTLEFSEMFGNFRTDSVLFQRLLLLDEVLGSQAPTTKTVPPQDSNPRLGCAAKPSRAINGAASGADSLLGDFGCYLFCADWGALEVPLRCP